MWLEAKFKMKIKLEKESFRVRVQSFQECLPAHEKKLIIILTCAVPLMMQILSYTESE